MQNLFTKKVYLFYHNGLHFHKGIVGKDERWKCGLKIINWSLKENEVLWRTNNLLCKVNPLFCKVDFFPAKIPFSKIQKKNLAGKNLLCKWTRSTGKSSWKSETHMRPHPSHGKKSESCKKYVFHIFFVCNFFFCNSIKSQS